MIWGAFSNREMISPNSSVKCTGNVKLAKTRGRFSRNNHIYAQIQCMVYIMQMSKVKKCTLQVLLIKKYDYDKFVL